MDRWTDGRTDGWRMDGQMVGRADGRRGGWKDGQMDGWTDGRTDTWRVGQMDGSIHWMDTAFYEDARASKNRIRAFAIFVFIFLKFTIRSQSWLAHALE